MRRGIALALVLLVLGALTNLALTAGVALLTPIPTYPRTHAGAFIRWERAWSTAELRRFGVVDRMWHDYAQNEPVRTPRALLSALVAPPPAAETLLAKARADQEQLKQHRPEVVIVEGVPRWGTFAQGAAPPSPYAMGSDTGFGWPTPCLWYQVLTGFSPATMSTTGDVLEGGFLVRGPVSSIDKSGVRVIPLRPIWGGVAVNTLVFAAAWAMPVLGLPAARRGRRRRRGWCVGCGYDLRGIPAAACPECGRAGPGGAGAGGRGAGGRTIGVAPREEGSGGAGAEVPTCPGSASQTH